MSRAKNIEQMIINKFANELKSKFEELNVFHRVSESYPTIYKKQVTEIQDMRCRIKKLFIVEVIQTPVRTAIQYQVTTDRGPYWYEIGEMTVPMHMFK